MDFSTDETVAAYAKRLRVKTLQVEWLAERLAASPGSFAHTKETLIITAQGYAEEQIAQADSRKSGGGRSV